MATTDKPEVRRFKACKGCPYESECVSCVWSAVRDVIDGEIKTTIVPHCICY